MSDGFTPHEERAQLYAGEGCEGCGAVAGTFSECPACGGEWCSDCWGNGTEICPDCVAKIAEPQWEGE